MSNFVVYYHKDNQENIRYIGSGTLLRAYNLNPKSGRGFPYEDYVNQNGKLLVEIVATNLSKEESIRLETELFLSNSETTTILNCRKPKTISLEINNDITSCFIQSNNSPSGLMWAEGKRNSGNNSFRKTTSNAGSISRKGYWVVKINNKSFKIHRIIYKMHYPEEDISNLVIDHIDGNPLNNNITNLRAVTNKVNSKNMRFKNNKELPTGLMFIDKGTVIQAHVVNTNVKSIKGVSKIIRKRFNPKKLGSLSVAIDHAIMWRNHMINLLKLEYTSDHGNKQTKGTK